MASKLEQLKKKQAQLTAQIKDVEAREKEKERKLETRRKILVGSFYLDKAKENGSIDQLKNELDSYLTRKDDRALFDLPPKG